MYALITQYRATCDVPFCGKNSGMHHDHTVLSQQLLQQGWDVQGSGAIVLHRCPACVKKSLYPTNWTRTDAVHGTAAPRPAKDSG